MPNIGPTELIILLVIVLLIFGPKRLPGLGRQLGSGMREFKDSITGKDKDDDADEHEAVGNRPELSEAASPPVAAEERAEERAEQPTTPSGS
jgi:sec-independent protein translocase protein TatA